MASWPKFHTPATPRTKFQLMFSTSSTSPVTITVRMYWLL